MYYVERVRECEHVFEPHRMQGYGRFSRRPCTLFALVGAAALSRTHRSLHSVVAAFTRSIFSSIFTPGFQLFLPHSHPNFCHFDVTTMRQLVPLQCIQYLCVLPYLCLQNHACYTVQCQVLCEPHKFNNGIYPIQYVYKIHAPCRDIYTQFLCMG